MKRRICFLMCAVILLSLAACVSTPADTPQDPVKFYYPRTEFLYGKSNGVIGWEVRSGDIFQDDLALMFDSYLKGPSTDTLRNPFPKSLKFLDYSWNKGTLSLAFSREINFLKGVELTLACTCIAKTCFDLTDADSVQIMSGGTTEETVMTIYRDHVLTFDDTAQHSETTQPN